jgi:hypothetical protein
MFLLLPYLHWLPKALETTDELTTLGAFASGEVGDVVLGPVLLKFSMPVAYNAPTATNKTTTITTRIFELLLTIGNHDIYLYKNISNF